ncbi:MAG: DUF2813 domain-containing protein, partial [Aeromonas sp.]
MFLERIEIKGFRGINRLALGLDDTTVLIGENTWGKSSLLRALWCLLGQSQPYQFSTSDFFQPNDSGSEKSRHLQLVLTFSEHRPQMCQHSHRLARLAPVWVAHKDKFHRIHYRASADLTRDGRVLTQHSFLDGAGKLIALSHPEALVSLLITMNPVFRLRDSRHLASHRAAQSTRTSWDELQSHPLEALADQLFDSPQAIDEAELKQAWRAVQQLMTHYFNADAPPAEHKPRSLREIINRPMTVRQPSNLASLIRHADNRALLLAMAGMAASFLKARGNQELALGVRPIMLVEDPESRL